VNAYEWVGRDGIRRKVDALDEWIWYTPPSGVGRWITSSRAREVGHELLRLSAEVERLRGLLEWRPVSELPAGKRTVLLYAPIVGGNYRMSIGYIDEDGVWNCDGNALEAWQAVPTHWMPRPEPPEVCR